MERRDTEDFQWPYMPDPTLQNLQLSYPNYSRIAPGSQAPRNPNFYQNHGLQNYDLFQNPGSQVSFNPNFNQTHGLQNYDPFQNPGSQVSWNPNFNQNHALQNFDRFQNPGSQVSCNPNQNHALQNFDLFQNPGSLASCNPNALQNYDLFQNPSSSQVYPTTQTLPQVSRPFRSFYEGLEDSFSRMNLNVSANNNSHSPLISSSVPLQRMRIESVVRGRMGLYQEGFGGHSNSTRSIGSQNMVGGAIARSANFPSTLVANDLDFSLQRSSRAFEGLDYASSRRLINNSDVQSSCGNTLAVNGLQSGNFSSNSPSSIYNHRADYPQQLLKYSSLGEVFSDQSGYRFLQKKLYRKEIEIMLRKVKNCLHDLMVHQFHNSIIQKLFEAGNQEQRTQLLILLVSCEQKFLFVCTDDNGTRVVQKFMERISTQEEGAILLTALAPIAFTLANNIRGSHIIQRCLNKFSNEDTRLIVDEIAKHCYDTATDQNGCRILQQCLAYANEEAKMHMLDEIITNALDLSQHPFGNYVVQYVLGMKITYVISEIIVQLRGNFVTLSMNKHASHVVEKCLQNAGEEFSASIITEIMDHRDFLMVAQNPFGNFVVLRALVVSKGDIRKALVELIQQHLPSLESHIFGKNVARRIIGGRKRLYKPELYDVRIS